MVIVKNKPLVVLAAAEPAAGCWKCQATNALPAHFCAACGKLQPAVEVDHFRFFGLARKLNIDVAGLEREFYQLSRKLHPDAYSRASQEEQEWSLLKSSQLNDAYRTLKDPIARTRYLLEIEGVKLEEQSSAATEAARAAGAEKKQVVPPELLEEVFELNMRLQELRMNKEMGEDDPIIVRELHESKEKLGTRLKGLLTELQGYWGEWDRTIASPESNGAERARIRDKMVKVLNRRSYISNLVRDVSQAIGN